LSAAGQEAANNFGVNFGYKRLISVDFVLLNDGTDKSLTSENKITLTEQWRYLMETVVQGFTTNEQYKTKFELTLYTDSGTWTVSGNLEDISVRGDLSNNSNRIEGRLSLYQSANI
jgi:hypothetical protein